MPVDFESQEFLELSPKEKLQIAVEEYHKCQQSFEYYLKNYAYIRHPNAGNIKMNPFDFQLDATVPISEILLHRRTLESIQRLKEYKFRFDYEKWWHKISEEHIELVKHIPSAFHEFHRVTVNSPEYPLRIDTILLKSRQTGLSTAFQQLGIWHINFHSTVVDIVLSKTDREAKKFLKDATGSWELIPAPLKARRISKNEHELWLSLTGDTSVISGIQVLPPTPDAGRSFDPNMIVLDEFSTYRNAEEVWTAISMAVSAGGVIVIIATPKGVGNLYHKIWTATNKSLTVAMPGSKKSETSIENNLDFDSSDLSVFRPMVVHWSQLPLEEFKRRGFETPLAWYKHMRAKLALKGGERLVAQELDLNFSASGNTINVEIINNLDKVVLEREKKPKILQKDIPGLMIYDPPEDGNEYIIGIDTGEGVHQDSSAFHVIRIPKFTHELPKIVAAYNSNSVSIKQYKDIVKHTALLYNEAWMFIERNNHGHVLLTYFVQDNDYIPDKIFNKYDVNKNDFVKDVKGWLTSPGNRTILIRTLLDFLTEYQTSFSIPLMTLEELRTFVQNKQGKWEAMPGYHDDNLISLALAILGTQLLTQYKHWLASQKSSFVSSADIDYDMTMMSSNLIPDESSLKDKLTTDEEKKFLHKSEVDIDQIKEMLLDKEQHTQTQDTAKETSQRYKYKELSTTSEIDEDLFIF